MPEFPKVMVLSHRPSIDGHVVEGQSGKAVITADDPTTVYINGKDWYGAWPVEETDLVRALEEAKHKEEAEREALEQQRKAREERERARAEEWEREGMTPRLYLLTPDGEMLDPQGTKAFEWVRSYLKQTDKRPAEETS